MKENFSKEFCKKLWKKILGTLGWWDNCLINPAYHIEDCQISGKRLGSCGVWNMIIHNWLNFSGFCMWCTRLVMMQYANHTVQVSTNCHFYVEILSISRFSADWLIFRESAHCVVLHCALLHLLTISSLLDDHAADTTVSGCTASSQQPWTNFLLKNRPFDRSAGRGAPHKGLNLSKRFTNLPLESMSSILNSDPKICHDARIEV